MRRRLRVATLLLLILASSSSSAQTVDPECVDASPQAADYTFDATRGFRLCAPTQDADGLPLEVYELATCTIHVNGVGSMTQAATPGELLIFPPVVAPGVPKKSTEYAFCTGPGERMSDLTLTYGAILRMGKPLKPIQIKWN